MLDIWMSGIARAGGVEVQLVRTCETRAPRRDSRLMRWSKKVAARVLVMVGERLQSAGARLSEAGYGALGMRSTADF